MSLRSLFVAALATLVMAAPAPEIQARQGMTSNELQNGPCRDVTFIFARGSVEQGNMVCLSHPGVHQRDRADDPRVSSWDLESAAI
jgi:cutinase